jgi:hypothetical protein
MTTVRNVEQLRRLSKSSRKDPAFLGGIALELSALNPQESVRWQRRLNRYYFDCGCSGGAVGMLSMMTAYVVLTVWRHPQLTGIGWKDVMWGLVTAAVSSVVGQVLGLRHAKKQLLRSIEQLTLRLGSS